MKYKLLLHCIVFFLIACQSAGDRKIEVYSGSNNIAYHSCGNADTTLLFIHGWGINKSYWENQVSFFCPRYKVVTVDLPGFGSSGKRLDAPWKFDQYAEDIQRLIDQLKLKNAILIGHSMSGDLILDLAVKNPREIAGIVGVDNLQEPVPLFTEEELMSFDSFFSDMTVHFDSIVKLYMPSQLFQPSTDSLVRKRVMKDIMANEPSLAVKVLKENVLFSQQQRSAMRSLRIPLLLISSDVNPVNDSLLGLYCAKGYRVKTIPGCGHYPMIEQPENFNRALEQLLNASSAR